MATPLLEKFEIEGLHGDRNVTLRFNSGVTILVDSNGAGKTTVLNFLFYILDNKPWELSKYEFSKAVLTFDNGEFVEYTKESIATESFSSIWRNFSFHLSGKTEEILTQLFPQLLELSAQPSMHNLRSHPLFRRIDGMVNIPSSMLVDIIQTIKRKKIADPGIFSGRPSDEQQKKLVSLFPHHVLYFPTYRRIEEDLNSLGSRRPGKHRADDMYPEEIVQVGSDEALIQFGMNDVKQQIENITKEMQDSSMEWFSIVSGQMITQLTDGIQVSEEMMKRISDVAMLKIVLERIGSNIKPAKKEDILRIISSGEVRDEKYEPLVYFLFNLSKIYEQQKDQDDSIKTFAKVCNSYLIDSDKEFRYDESKLQLPINQKRSNRNVQLDRLSSGEKQVVSIFSRLYLMPRQTYAILFDEPELSLSMEWQRKLLCDVVGSERCPVIVAATHSPFIFDNELDPFTTQLEIKHVASEG